MEDYKKEEEIALYLKKLRYYSSKLRLLSVLIGFIALATIVLLTFFALTIDISDYSRKYIYDKETYYFLLIFPLFGIISLFMYNIIRNQGMTYYEEITDELSWGKNRQEYTERPPIEYRISVKMFLKSLDLPLTSGPNGQGFYFIFFIAIIVASVIFRITMIK